jgi:hypothetical protein
LLICFAHPRKLLPVEPEFSFPTLDLHSRDRCFSAGSFSCVTNWTASEGLQFSSAVFHFQVPHSSCLELGLGILFLWFPTRLCDFWRHQALQSARFQCQEARTKAFSLLIHRVRFFFSLEVPAVELIFWMWI